MKTKYLIIAALSLTTSFSIAQTAQDTIHKLKDHPKDKMVHVMMHNGTMMMMNNGQSVNMDKDMVLANGTTVSLDGTVKMKNGTTSQMKEGDSVDMNGNLHHPRMPKTVKK